MFDLLNGWDITLVGNLMSIEINEANSNSFWIDIINVDFFIYFTRLNRLYYCYLNITTK